MLLFCNRCFKCNKNEKVALFIHADNLYAYCEKCHKFFIPNSLNKEINDVSIFKKNIFL